VRKIKGASPSVVKCLSFGISFFIFLGSAAMAKSRTPSEAMVDLKGKDQAKKMEAASELSKMGKDAVPVIVEEMKNYGKLDKDSKILMAIILGRTGDERGDEHLRKMLKEDPDVLVGQSAAIGMGYSRRKEHIPALTEALNDDKKDKAVRMRAAWALGQMGDKSGKKLALEVLKSNKKADASAQYLSVEALESIGDESVVPELDRNWKDKKAYVWTRIWSKLAAKRVKFHNVKQEERLMFLEEALADPQFEVNDWAAGELLKDGSDVAINILSNCSTDKRNPGSYSCEKRLGYINARKARSNHSRKSK